MIFSRFDIAEIFLVCIILPSQACTLVNIWYSHWYWVYNYYIFPGSSLIKVVWRSIVYIYKKNAPFTRSLLDTWSLRSILNFYFACITYAHATCTILRRDQLFLSQPHLYSLRWHKVKIHSFHRICRRHFSVLKFKTFNIIWIYNLLTMRVHLYLMKVFLEWN